MQSDLIEQIRANSVTPNWPAPANIKAFSTTRHGGLSNGVYQGLNLGMHVDDDAQTVVKNRQLIEQALAMPSSPIWLSQVHSDKVLSFDNPTDDVFTADASFTQTSGVVCCVMTADCLPILLTNQAGTQVAAVHAGWRGLASGIVEKAVALFEKPSQVLAWVGPAIGPNAFEVGQDVYDAFVCYEPNRVDQEAADAFKYHPNALGKYFADMDKLVTLRLNRVGVDAVYSSQMCTYEDEANFYSYRRDGQTGRQASLIWIE
ncbi:MAG: peptidoglycan editing factor PgeF [Vibrio sp.]